MNNVPVPERVIYRRTILDAVVYLDQHVAWSVSVQVEASQGCALTTLDIE